ncbi:MAG: hypothetical protein DME48_07115 [Verrucomicrobia bacterium]|nr:MAG: hypothetical protein DME48_07115 [Verrucomicrobiota bacterium]
MLSLLDHVGIVCHPTIKNNSSAILAPGKAFADRFSCDSRKGERLAVVMGFVKDHVPKLAFVHKLTGTLNIQRSVLFLRRLACQNH